MSNNKLLSAYCFLASLTETQKDLFNGVYIPMGKRALSFYGERKARQGTDEDIQDYIKDLYGIEPPLRVVRKILKGIYEGLSRKERDETAFKLFHEGQSFEFKKYGFSEFEEKYKEGERNANKINQNFKEFLKKSGQKESTSFSDFLSLNRKNLSSFFSVNGSTSSHNQTIDQNFYNHVMFLEYIAKNDNELYKIAEKIYLGSIVAAFLEVDFDFNVKPVNKVTYYLDTQIVLEALDLQSKERSKPTMELINLIKSVNGKLKVLNITIEEIRSVLKYSIDFYKKDAPINTVHEALARKGLNKTYLISLESKLEEALKEKLEVELEDIPDDMLKKYRKSQDANELTQIWRKKEAALHDVCSYLYVRHKRGEKATNFNKTKFWFLTPNKDLKDFNFNKKVNSKIPEIIMPEYLTSLLWTQNPKALFNKTKSLGLNELIAVTIDEEVASRELINEFDENVQRNSEINGEDYEILLTSIANQSAKNIENLNNLAHENPENFNNEALKIVQNERARRKSERENVRKANFDNEELQKKNEEQRQSIKEIHKNLSEIRKENNEKNDKIKGFEDKLSRKNNYIFIFIAILVTFVVSFILIIIPNVPYWLDLIGTILSYIAATFTLFFGIKSAVEYFNQKE